MYKEEEIENLIIQTLKSHFGDYIEVRAYQNNIQDFVSEHKNGSILVSYAGTYPDSQYEAVEYHTVRFGVDLLFRNIKTHIDAFPVLRDIRDAMKELYFEIDSQTFLDIDGDVWHYTMTYSKRFIYEPE